MSPSIVLILIGMLLDLTCFVILSIDGLSSRKSDQRLAILQEHVLRTEAAVSDLEHEPPAPGFELEGQKYDDVIAIMKGGLGDAAVIDKRKLADMMSQATDDYDQHKLLVFIATVCLGIASVLQIVGFVIHELKPADGASVSCGRSVEISDMRPFAQRLSACS